MMKFLVIIFFLNLYIPKDSCAQDLKKMEGGKTSPKGKKPQPPKPNKSNLPVASNNKTVKVSTNEDCNFKIDSKNYGTLKAGATKTITLSVGTYKLVAT